MLIKTETPEISAVDPGVFLTWLGRRKTVLAILIVVLCSGGVFGGLKQA